MSTLALSPLDDHASDPDGSVLWLPLFDHLSLSRYLMPAHRSSVHNPFLQGSDIPDPVDRVPSLPLHDLLLLSRFSVHPHNSSAPALSAPLYCRATPNC